MEFRNNPCTRLIGIVAWIQMKRESETKRKLLEVAMKLIWEQSYGSVGVDDICKQAGVTKGSFYFAFPSKSDLAVAAFEKHWEIKQPMMDRVFSSQLSAQDQLDLYFAAIVSDQLEKYKTFGKLCGCPYCSVGSELSTQDEKIRLKAEQMAERMIRYLTGFVRTAQAEGLVAEEDPVLLARQVYDFVAGLLIRAKIENNPDALDRLKPGVLRLLGWKTPLVGALAD